MSSTEHDSEKLTHFEPTGEARMVDVGDKEATDRVAEAAAEIRAKPETIEAVRRQAIKKGDVVAVARVAGILAAKQTSSLIPLCHPIPITSVTVEVELTSQSLITVRATVHTHGQTGVEMEALTAVTVAALTVYDMCKAIDRGMTIERVGLVSKSGGKSGTWKADRAGA